MMDKQEQKYVQVLCCVQVCNYGYKSRRAAQDCNWDTEYFVRSCYPRLAVAPCSPTSCCIPEMDLSFDQLEEMIATSRVVYSDSYSEESSYCSSSAENSPVRSGPGAVTSRRRPSRTVMNDRDKGIYNSLGSSSSSSGKVNKLWYSPTIA